MYHLIVPSSSGNFYQKNMTVILHPLYFSLFPRLKIKLKGRHFDRIEVIGEESQAVLNTLTEHNFQDAFKKMAEALRTVNTGGRGLLQVQWWPAGPKLVLDQMTA
jgi:hypothetical protein